MNITDFLLMNLALAVFYLTYRVFLHSETHFRWSRTFLLSGVLAVLILPFIPLPSVPGDFRMDALTLPVVEISASEATSTFSWWKAMLIAYFAIAAMFVLQSLISLLHTFLKIRTANPLPYFGNSVFNSPDDSSFSFLGKIYLQTNLDEEEQLAILAHERIHQKEGHSFDLLLAEALKAIFWINPFAWLYKKRLTEIHEYTADAAVTEELNDKTTYQELLVANALGVRRKELIHPFINQSMLKRRIMMINKNSSSKWSKLRYALFIPALAGMVALASCQKTAEKEVKEVDLIKRGQQELPENFAHPEYPGGQEKLIAFLIDNIQYPEEAKSAGTEGNVFAGFTVEPDGSISDIKILKGVSADLDQETIRVINEMPDWSPGTKDDQPVAVEMTLPVSYKLPAEE